MKPLLIIPPAPTRWPAMQALPLHDDPLWSADLEKRFSHGVAGSQDAFAVIPDGGHMLACAALSKRHDLGILTRVFTRPEQRRHGLARALTEALLAWFEMTGGKWLYATTTPELADGFFARLGFGPLRRATRTPAAAVVLLRATGGACGDPLALADGNISIHNVTRANWPTMATLLFYRPGPDSRVPLDDSAVTAEITALDLISRQEAGTCQLKAAFHGPRLVALATVATDQLGDRTYAMVMPHTGAPAQLRAAIVEFARTKGYEHVEFPMEALAPTASAPQAPDGSAAGGDEAVPSGAAQIPAGHSEPCAARAPTGDAEFPPSDLGDAVPPAPTMHETH